MSLKVVLWFSAGGESVAENCQILQTRVNRLKSDKQEVDSSQLKSYSCDIKFTGTFCFCFLLHSFLCSYAVVLVTRVLLFSISRNAGERISGISDGVL